MKAITQWEAKSWKQVFDVAARTRDRSALRAARKSVFDYTVECVKRGGYVMDNGDFIQLPDGEEMRSHTRFYAQELPYDCSKSGLYETDVEVVNQDCLVFAREICKKYGAEKVSVLNMANRQNPGGGVYYGAGAQEEYLFRCSNYYYSLYQFSSYAELYDLPKSCAQYPMDRNFGGIFSLGVTVFRDCEEKGYPLLISP